MSTVLVLSIHEIISPENYKFFKGVVPMDKITHQVRAEHWTKIMNECIKLILCKQDQSACRKRSPFGGLFLVLREKMRYNSVG